MTTMERHEEPLKLNKFFQIIRASWRAFPVRLITLIHDIEYRFKATSFRGNEAPPSRYRDSKQAGMIHLQRA